METMIQNTYLSFSMSKWKNLSQSFNESWYVVLNNIISYKKYD